MHKSGHKVVPSTIALTAASCGIDTSKRRPSQLFTATLLSSDLDRLSKESTKSYLSGCCDSPDDAGGAAGEVGEDVAGEEVVS